MKVRSINYLLFICALGILFPSIAKSQQYKLRQVSSVATMKIESTIYVKGSRKRTEGSGYAGMGANLVTIEQCDLQRTIRINDKKKLYFIEPFVKETEEEEETKPATKTKPAPATTTTTTKPQETKKGGIIYMYYNVTDTGERKKMFGVTARHVWSTQKMKPSADACMMKDSMLIKTDGWYIDLPEFNCPVSYNGRSMGGKNDGKLECRDKFVSKRTGKGKLGFPLIEKRTMIMGGRTETSNYETNIETLEFSTVKLDSLLFEIPIGYQETKNEEDLQEPFDANAYMKQMSDGQSSQMPSVINPSDAKKAGSIRIGVLVPVGESSLQAGVLQQRMVQTLNVNRVEAIAVSSEEEAKKYNCDLTLKTDITKVKQGSKAGSILKAIKNTDPTATSAFNVDATMTLINTSSGSTKAEEKVSGKFDGKADEAAARALEKGCGSLLESIRN